MGGRLVEGSRTMARVESGDVGGRGMGVVTAREAHDLTISALPGP